MKKKETSKLGLTNNINDRLAYGVLLGAVIIGFIIIETSIWSLYQQIDRMTDLHVIQTSSKIADEQKTFGLTGTKEPLTIKIKIDGKKQRIFDGENESAEKISIADALDEIKETKGLDVSYETKDNNTVIKKIDGVEVKDGSILSYFLNGKPIANDIKQVEVSAGDLVEITTL